MTTEYAVKVAHTVVLDAGAIIKNEPPVSTLLGQFEELVTVPAIISEIKDATTRNRVDTTLRPFLTLRSPQPSSVKFVADFARRTGDLAVLSRPDLEIIALTYEIECERNGGDWRLRNAPGQKKLNGAPPSKSLGGISSENYDSLPSDVLADETVSLPSREPIGEEESSSLILKDLTTVNNEENEKNISIEIQQQAADEQQFSGRPQNSTTEEISRLLSQAGLDDAAHDTPAHIKNTLSKMNVKRSSIEDTDSDSEGWITPSNLKKRQAQDVAQSSTEGLEPKMMQVAVLTSDFAMQNVILQINLNLLSHSLSRVKHLKTYVLRCHACFQITKDMTKQFCPKCGQPALTRVSCSTNLKGEFTLHLKRDMQWNNRGNRYSIPKPAHGSANSKVRGGGKDGWGHSLILAEDQKEFQRATTEEKRRKERSLMDEDYLPDILTGQRGKQGGKIKIGAGRNVNSRKR